MKLLFVVGTRPEAIKLSPVILEAKALNHDVTVFATGQHDSMVVSIFDWFDIEDKSIGLIKHRLNRDYSNIYAGQSINKTLAEIIEKVDCYLNPESTLYKQFDFVIVQGDTTSALAGAIAGFNRKIKVVHVEAGLRTNDLTSPFPEEGNRQLISRIASVHFAPTEIDAYRLNQENIKRVDVVGNTVTDAARLTLSLTLIKAFTLTWSNEKEYHVLFTCHRRENIPMLESYYKVLIDLCNEFPDLNFIYPIHPNNQVKEIMDRLRIEIVKPSNLDLVDPLSYPDTINIINDCKILITDSGGLQEEASYLTTPVIVMRESTERVNGIMAGTAFLTANPERIFKTAKDLLTDERLYNSSTEGQYIYGDGHVSNKIIKILETRLAEES